MANFVTGSEYPRVNDEHITWKKAPKTYEMQLNSGGRYLASYTYPDRPVRASYERQETHSLEHYQHNPVYLV